MKAGELAGLSDLSLDVADRTLPRMIVPPAEERDNALQMELFKTEDGPSVANTLLAYWRGRPVFVQTTYLLPDLKHEAVGRWLPRMFEQAQRAGVPAIPLATLADLTPDTREAYRAACSTGPIRFAVAILAEDLVGRDSLAPLLRQLEAMRLSPLNCSVIADFGSSDLAKPDIVAPIIGGALELLQEVGTWGQVIFQGTNYPDRNPAESGSECLVPRTEWQAWRKAVSFDPATAGHILFGDYAADCATMSFGGRGARAIPHYRYTTPDAWLVVRGAENGKVETTMSDVCRRITESGHFAGRYFSSADDFIFRTAYGEAGPGNSTTWRAVNTTHHITRAVADIGNVRGFTLQQLARPLPTFQGNLFTSL